MKTRAYIPLRESWRLGQLSLCASIALWVAAAVSARAVSVDSQFHSPVLSFNTQPYRVFSNADGTFFVARNFNRFNAEDRGPLLKFRVDRTLDPSFRMPSGYFQVNAIASAPDGDLFVSARQVDRTASAATQLRA